MSSILTGLCLSILLFLTWLSIMSIFDNSVPQKIKVSGNYTSGKEDGYWKYYHENGQLWKIGNYVNDMT